MFNNINLYAPDHVIKCGDLNDSSDIYGIMKKMNAESYAYCFAYIPIGKLVFEVLKFGLSSPAADRKSNSYGERLVRQVAHVPGWTKQATSPHGYDFSLGLSRLKEQKVIPEYVNRNHLMIGIWNTDKMFRGKCKSQFAEPDDMAAWLEGELCNQYKVKNNYDLPPLNISDPTKTSVYLDPKTFAFSNENTIPVGIELFKF